MRRQVVHVDPAHELFAQTMCAALECFLSASARPINRGRTQHQPRPRARGNRLLHCQPLRTRPRARIGRRVLIYHQVMAVNRGRRQVNHARRDALPGRQKILRSFRRNGVKHQHAGLRMRRHITRANHRRSRNHKPRWIARADGDMGSLSQEAFRHAPSGISATENQDIQPAMVAQRHPTEPRA